jgi:hypothetical protein
MERELSVERDEKATALAQSMLERDDIMRTILGETIMSAKKGKIRESGRTKCPTIGQVKGSLQRFPRAVDLASCPRSKGGTWHTHVTADEITTPTNSLPDAANVLFGLTDVSIVVGTRTADVVVAPADPEVGAQAYRNAIGADVNGPRDVTEVIEQGRLFPSKARERLREQLSPLFYTVETGYVDLDREARTTPPEDWATAPGSGRNEKVAGNGYAPTMFAPQSIQAAADSADSAFDGLEISELVVSQALGTIVGNLVDSVFFNR